ncbi:hypothetical protein QL285_020459 [Trifolium repens]|nr:hypothetical protein QL285_020459 [Trifolium repens]
MCEELFPGEMNGRFSMLKWFQVKRATHVLVLINSKVFQYLFENTGVVHSTYTGNAACYADMIVWWKDKPSKGT